MGDTLAIPKRLALDQVHGYIETRNIKHVYRSRPGVVAANGLSISFPSGKVTAVVGPSGSGRSSIAKLILRFYEPISGQTPLDDHNLQELNMKWLRRQVRLVNQEPFLFGTTIAENIAYGFTGTRLELLSAEEKRKRVDEAARTAGAHDFITNLPQGYQMTA